MTNDKPKKLILKWVSYGNVEICCPYCKKAIFAGFHEGFTWYHLDGKCPYCKKEIDENWEAEK